MAQKKNIKKSRKSVKIKKFIPLETDQEILDMLKEEELVMLEVENKTTKKAKVRNPWVLSSIDMEHVQKASKEDLAFKKLLDSNKGYLERIILKYVRRNDASFDDLYQVACISLHKALKKYDETRRNKSKFITFAWRVIANDVLFEVMRQNNINHHEGRSLEHFQYRDENGGGPFDDRWAVDFREMKWVNIPTYNMEDTIINDLARQQYLNTFSDLEHQIIQLRLQNMKIKDIAQKVGKNIHLVKNIYYKAVRKPHFRELIIS